MNVNDFPKLERYSVDRSPCTDTERERWAKILSDFRRHIFSSLESGCKLCSLEPSLAADLIHEIDEHAEALSKPLRLVDGTEAIVLAMAHRGIWVRIRHFWIPAHRDLPYCQDEIDRVAHAVLLCPSCDIAEAERRSKAA